MMSDLVYVYIYIDYMFFFYLWQKHSSYIILKNLFEMIVMATSVATCTYTLQKNIM